MRPSVLVVDDERPALDELAFLLRRDPRVEEVATADSAAEALRVLQEGAVDAVFTDIADARAHRPRPRPGAVALPHRRHRSSSSPPTTSHAVDAFDLNAVDYVLKPVRDERLAEAVRRVVEVSGHRDGRADDEDSIPVELGGVTRFVARSDVLYVEAQGDYARLHTAPAAT